MKKVKFLAMFATFFTVNVHSAFIFDSQVKGKVGLYIGAKIWQNEATGALGEESSLIDFNAKQELQSNYFIAIVHPLALLPNIQISNNTLNNSGKINAMQAFNFGGERFPISSNETGTDDHTGANMSTTIDVDLDANINVSYIDYTFSYELINTGLFSLDLGGTARHFNGDVIVSAKTTTVIHVDEADHGDHVHPGIEETSTSITQGRIKVNEIEPMLYIAANVGLPVMDLSFFSQSNISLKNKHTLHDYQLGLHYNFVSNQWIDLNLTLGYQLVNMKFNDVNNLYTDLEFKGIFIGTVARF